MANCYSINMTPLWPKAIEASDDARFLFSGQRYDAACNRAYYAMFNAARALLIEICGVPVHKIKRHATIARLFSLHLVVNGPFEKEFGAILKRTEDARIIADYEGGTIAMDEAQRVITAMDRFMATATSLMKKRESGT